MRLTVQKDPSAHRIAHTAWTSGTLNRLIISPALRNIADVLIRDLRQAFSGSIRASGGMASGFDQTSINDHSVGITQAQAYEQHIREGTSGPYKGFPRRVVTWMNVYKGVPIREAFAIAKSIQQSGTAKTFTGLYPAGERRFEYTEWVVEKHQSDFQGWAGQIGDGIVKYVTAGNTWSSKKIG